MEAARRVRFDWHLWSPAEANRLTGMPQHAQVDLRRHGLLDTRAQHYRFDLFGLTYLQAIVKLRPVLGLKRAAAAGKLAAFGTANYVLAWNQSYSGEHEQTLAWDAAIYEQIEAWRASLALLRLPETTREQELVELERISPPAEVLWPTQAAWLRRQILGVRGVNECPPRYLVCWPGDTYGWKASIDEAIAARTADSIPLIVFDQDRAALELIEASEGRPFVDVKFK